VRRWPAVPGLNCHAGSATYCGWLRLRSGGSAQHL